LFVLEALNADKTSFLPFFVLQGTKKDSNLGQQVLRYSARMFA
jgi:hypothetical protein